MNKLKQIAFALLFAIAITAMATTANAQEVPACPENSHYEGEYIETATDNYVCTRSFWGFCVRWENQPVITGEWSGECVADTIEEPEEAISTTTPDEETPIINTKKSSTPLAPVKASSLNYFIDCNGDVRIGVLASGMSTSILSIVDKATGIDLVYSIEVPTVYHDYSLELPRGEYTATMRIDIKDQYGRIGAFTKSSDIIIN